MKRIPLSGGKFAIVDDEDFGWLNQWKWSFSAGYAGRYEGRTFVYMHRLLNRTPQGVDTDHINRDKLDNRKGNLRSATRAGNQRNRGLQRNNKSGHRGVCWDKVNQKWLAHVTVNYQYLNLGRFGVLNDAVEARKQAEQAYFGVAAI